MRICAIVLFYNWYTLLCAVLRRARVREKIAFFEAKLIFEISIERGRQHSFSTHERMLLRKCRSFETENVSTQGGREPPTFGIMPNAFIISALRARLFAAPVLNTGFGGTDTEFLVTISGQYTTIANVPSHLCTLNCMQRRGCNVINYNHTKRYCRMTPEDCQEIVEDSKFSVTLPFSLQ